VRVLTRTIRRRWHNKDHTQASSFIFRHRRAVVKTLTYFQTTAVKELLWISPGIASPLLRVVPPSEATIAHVFIPGKVSQMSSPFERTLSTSPGSQPSSFTLQTLVEMSSRLVHRNESVFEKWLYPRLMARKERDRNSTNDSWLFSRGPRSCLGRAYTFTSRSNVIGKRAVTVSEPSFFPKRVYNINFILFNTSICHQFAIKTRKI
jgi:hypothetical protein